MCKIFPYFHEFFLVSVVALFEKMDSFNEKIKKDINISIAFLFYILGLNVKFESLIKNKSGSYLELYINELASFLMSEEFLNICYFVLEGKYEHPLGGLVLVCELNEDIFFIKCFFPLLEKLMILKFETQLIKLKNYHPQIKKEEYIKEFINQIIQLFHKEKEISSKKLENFSFEKLNSFKISNYRIFHLSFEILFEKKDSFKEKYFEGLDNFLRCPKEKKSIKDLFEYYNKIDSLTHIQDLYQIFTFILNINLCPEEKSKNFDSLSNLKSLVLNTNLNENIIFIFEKKLNIPPLVLKRNEKKFSVNFLEIIDITKINSINIFIGKNLFTEKKIMIIKINEKKLKEKKIIFEELKNRINNNKNNKIYIQFDKYKELKEWKELNDSDLKEIFELF